MSLCLNLEYYISLLIIEEVKRHGAIPINLNSDPVSLIKKVTDDRGADAVLEVVGHGDALQLGYNLIRPWGVIASVGVQQDALPFKGPQVYDKKRRFTVWTMSSSSFISRSSTTLL